MCACVYTNYMDVSTVSASRVKSHTQMCTSFWKISCQWMARTAAEEEKKEKLLFKISYALKRVAEFCLDQYTRLS